MSTQTTDRQLLEAQVCFAMYNASRAITARYRDLLAPLGLTYPQYLVMLVLWQDSPQAISDLGRRLHLDSGTLSPLLKRLQVMELVDRRRSTDDERVVFVTLTPRGADLRRQAEHIPDAICEAMGLDFDDAQALREQIDAAAEHVRATVNRTDAPT